MILRATDFGGWRLEAGIGGGALAPAVAGQASGGGRKGGNLIETKRVIFRSPV